MISWAASTKAESVVLLLSTNENSITDRLSVFVLKRFEWVPVRVHPCLLATTA